MSTDETALSTGNGKSGLPLAKSAPKQVYSLNDSLLMLNSALRYLSRCGIEVTLQRFETGVVLTLHGIGYQKNPSGATRLVPLTTETATAIDASAPQTTESD